MSKKQKNETSAKAPVKLTRAEKKEIQAVIRKYKGDGKPHSAQASIPYEAMYQDGVCRVTPRTFSKCIEFTDISYQLAQADTKTAIFENLCDLYNYLDASIHVQFSFINRKIDPKQYAKSFEIRAQGDDFDDIRSEYSDILQDQLVNGNNGLMKRKFMTYTIEADSLKMARARLRRIETDLLGYFKSMGASAWGLDAKERLEVMHSIFHPDGEPFSFDWKWLAPSGLSTKDFIAPSSFRFGNARMFGLGGKYGAVSFLQILSPELSDEMLADFLNTENGIVVNLHVQAIDQSDAIKTVKRKITDLDAMKIQEQKRAVRSGYDMDILPSDLATYGQDAKELLKTLQSRNERMFQLTFLVLNTADTRQKLENDVFWAAGIAQKYNCSLVRLDYQQEQGLMSSLPLGASHIQIERSLTTSSVAVFVPFVTQELFQGGDAMYYGINAKTGNMIMLDRKRARCPNGLKLGTPGSGKSMSCKSEILSVFLCTPDDVYICDPEAEYYPLVKRLHGQVVKLSPTSKNYVNPLDIRQREFDLVLLDINLPDGNGFELCRLIKPQHPDTIIIFLTANDQESDQIRGYEVGAVDYITKPFVIRALQRKIKAMFAMLEHHKPAKDIYDDGRLFLDFSEQTASLNGKPLTLSPMEYKMLNLFRKNPRQVLTRGQLLEKLWDIDEKYVDEHTLTTSISRIRSKIESDGGAPYIKTVYGMGYQWTGGEAK